MSRNAVYSNRAAHAYVIEPDTTDRYTCSFPEFLPFSQDLFYFSSYKDFNMYTQAELFSVLGTEVMNSIKFKTMYSYVWKATERFGERHHHRTFHNPYSSGNKKCIYNGRTMVLFHLDYDTGITVSIIRSGTGIMQAHYNTLLHVE